MKKLEYVKIIFCSLVSMFIGCAISYYLLDNFSIKFLEDASLQKTAVEVQYNVYVLQRIKRGDIDGGLELIENNLDGNIIGLMRVNRNEYSDLTNDAVEKAISLAGNYRNEYERKTDNPEIDKAVFDILSKK